MDMNFFPVPAGTPLALGLVLQVCDAEVTRILRITHLFPNEAFLMEVSTPEAARYARRPRATRLTTIDEWRKRDGTVLGRLSLPRAFSRHATSDDPHRNEKLAAAFDLIAPLVEACKRAANLRRGTFTALIRNRAAELDVSVTTVRRLLLRYYYFGQVRDALMPLPSGAAPGTATYASMDSSGKAMKRRGRQPIIAKKLGRNEFVVSEPDILDMVACYKSCLRKGVTYKSHAHESYLRKYFAKRHPELFKKYLSKGCPEPVTYRQFAEYLKAHAVLDAVLERNLPHRSQRRTKVGALRAIGPGEVYEIDATGGRIFIVDSQDTAVVLGTPTIYLLIDRWSRFIPSVFVSAKAPSWEEARYALLIAFTPRKRRFKALGVDVDEDRWPTGRICAALVQDRGSEFLSSDAARAAAGSLRIELDTLPPFCPDGKAIIERLIRELKRRMAGSHGKSTFARRPIGPQERRDFKRAKQAATYSLAEIYRVLIEIVIDHNTRPHSALKRRAQLTRAGVRPTPQEAYLWGIANITGIQIPPLTDEDIRRMLLSTVSARVSKGVLRYRDKSFLPENALAERIARAAGSRGTSCDIRIDKTDPIEAYIESLRGEWAEWRMTVASQMELRGTALDEGDLLHDAARALAAEAGNDSRSTGCARASAAASRTPAIVA